MERGLVRVSWFIVGFASALVLALVVWRPWRYQLVRRPTMADRPTATVATPGPRLTPNPQATSASTQSDGLVSLSWLDDNSIAGTCRRLRIDAEGLAFYGPCDHSMRAAGLTSAELLSYGQYTTRYAPFVFHSRRTPDPVNNSSERLQLTGRGQYAPSPEQQAEVASWAAQVYERLVRKDVEEDLASLAIANLSGRLGVPSASIRAISIERVTWADACLGISTPGGSCEPTLTSGLRILLEAGGNEFEYRTDLLGLAVPVDVPGVAPLRTRSPSDQAPEEGVARTRMPITATPLPESGLTPAPGPTPTLLLITDWLGEYYGNGSLLGAPSLVRNDRELAFDWGGESPHSDLPVDYFSVRWNRRWRFDYGYYRFDVRSDDGVRLWVDGQLLLDRWGEGYVDESVVARVESGTREIVVEYYEARGLAEIGLTWELLTATPTPTWDPDILNWRGEYYTNMSLSGAPALVRGDEEIDFDWGSGRPSSALPNDRFSVRWTRRLYFESGAHHFSARVDDGVRIWVDEHPVIEAWRTGKVETFDGYFWLERGEHDVRVEYYEYTGEAEIDIEWEHLDDLGQWVGEYYANRELDGPPALIRLDSELSFDWGRGGPSSGMPEDSFSARWTRMVSLTSGRYRFRAHADDGVRVHVDGALMIDEWHDSADDVYEIEIDLAYGAHEIVVEYYERMGGARIGIEWERL